MQSRDEQSGSVESGSSSSAHESLSASLSAGSDALRRSARSEARRGESLSHLAMHPTLFGNTTRTARTATRGMGMLGTGLTLGDGLSETVNSETPLIELTHQAARISTAIMGGLTGLELSAVPCAVVGALYPPAAPLTVPACLFASSVAGAAVGEQAGEMAWQSAYTLGHQLSAAGTASSSTAPVVPFSDEQAAFELRELAMEPVAYRDAPSSTGSLYDELDDMGALDAPRPAERPTLTPALEQAMAENPAETVVRAIDDMQENMSELVRTWCSRDNNITGYEDCPAIVAQSAEVTRLSEAGKTTEAAAALRGLNDAKAQEHRQRLDFDNKLNTAQGLVSLASAAATITGNPKLARQIVVGGGALISLGKNVGALMNMGTAAAAVNPIMAAGSIALALCSVASLFGDEGGNATEAILASIAEVKALVELLRREMHERFDIIEEKLERLHVDLTAQIRQLSLQTRGVELQIAEAARDNRAAHQVTHDYLQTVQQRIDLLSAQHHDARVSDALNAIINPIRESVLTVKHLLEPERYAKLLSRFQRFLEADTLSPLLSGGSQEPMASQWNLQGCSSSNALFHLNSLLKHLNGGELPARQPNVLLWSYSALAILRLVYLTNNNETQTIRRTEFNILENMQRMADATDASLKSLKHPDIAKRLINEYSTALTAVGREMSRFLQEWTMAKNQTFSEYLELEEQRQWEAQAHALAGQDIMVRTDYSGWFLRHTDCHYGGSGTNHYADASRDAYTAHRKGLLESVKTPPERGTARIAVSDTQGVILQGRMRGTVLVPDHRDPRICLLPEAKGDPVLNLSHQGQTIDFRRLMGLDAAYFQAEYLGLGRLEYRYRIESAQSGEQTLVMTPYFVVSREGARLLPETEYPLQTLRCAFNMGPYARSEGILWGWFGDTVCTVTRPSAIITYGSTGEAKHWFRHHYSTVTVSCPDAGPLRSLLNPQQPDARAMQLEDVFSFMEVRTTIRKAVSQRVDALSAEFESALNHRLTVGGADNTQYQALEHLEACVQRLRAYVMLALPDCYDAQDPRLQFLAPDATVLHTRTMLLNACSPKAVDALTTFSLSRLMDFQTKLENPLHQLLTLHAETTANSLFDAVRGQVMQACGFYAGRVDERGAYSDIFAENQATHQHFDAVEALLRSMVQTLDVETQGNPQLRERILAGTRERFFQQGGNLQHLASALQSGPSRSDLRLSVADPESQAAASHGEEETGQMRLL